MHFHLDPLSILAAVATVATALGGWLGHRITTPKAHERAALISQVANDAASLIVSLNPNADWATLLKLAVERAAAGAGTTNRDALENAVAGALTELGKNPNAKP